MTKISFPAVNTLSAYGEEFIRVRKEVFDKLATRSSLLGLTVEGGTTETGTYSAMAVYTFNGRPVAISRTRSEKLYRYVNSSLLSSARERGYDW